MSSSSATVTLAQKSLLWTSAMAAAFGLHLGQVLHGRSPTWLRRSALRSAKLRELFRCSVCELATSRSNW